MRFAICNETFQGWSFEKTCNFVAECGYDGLEVAPFTLKHDPRTLTLEEAGDYAAHAKIAGIEIIGLHWLLLRPAWLNLTTDDTLLQKDTIKFGKHLARFCAALGGSVMVWGSPKQRILEDGWDYDEAAKRAADVLHQIAEVAHEGGVTIALEPLARGETNFLNTAAETVKFIRKIDHPACRLHLDVKAMSDEDTPIPQIIANNYTDLAHFHANDPNLRGPGTGEVDFHPIADALKTSGYNGYVSTEVFDYTPDPETIAKDSIAYLKKMFGTS